MLKSYKRNIWLMFPLIILFLSSIIGTIIACLTIDKKGISGYFVIESAILIIISLIVLSICIVKKNKEKIFIMNMILILISTISMFAQFLPYTLASTMPNRYFSMGASFGFVYNINLLQGEFGANILNIQKSYYIFNTNMLISIVLIVINTKYIVNCKSKRSSNSGRTS